MHHDQWGTGKGGPILAAKISPGSLIRSMHHDQWGDCFWIEGTIGVAKPGHTRAAARASPIFAPASASYVSGFLGITKQAHILNIHALLYLTYNTFMVPML